MIRAVMVTGVGQRVVLLGLSRENVRRLTELGQPIHVDLDELLSGGPPANSIAIMFGETEEAIVEDMRQSGMRIPTVQERGSDHVPGRSS